MASAPSFLTIAKRRWKDAAWVTGEGRFACLAHCRVLTVTLWETREQAEKAKRQIDQFRCGGQCGGEAGHEIVEL